MRGILGAGAAVFLAACGPGGPGYFPAYMVHFERADIPEQITHPDWSGPGTLLGITPAGDWVVDGPQGRWLVEPAAMTLLHELPSGLFWITPSGFVSAPEGTAGTFLPYDDLANPRPIPAPDALDVVTDFTVDPQMERVYMGGVSEGAPGPQGAAYESADWGATWTQIANLLQPVQGEVASVVFAGVAGFQRVGVCPPSGVYESGSPVCEDYRLFGGGTTRGYVYNLPTPMGWDAEGRVLATCSPENHGRPDLGLVVLDPDQAETTCDALPPVLGSFLPEGGQAWVDLDGHLWTLGWNLEDHGYFRSSEPAGDAFDQRDVLLGGWGCEDYFRADLVGGSAGRDAEMTLTNGLDEPVSLHKVLNYRPQGANPQLVGPPLAPGAEVTVSARENEWWMALTFDGRCAGFGQTARLDGRTLR